MPIDTKSRSIGVHFSRASDEWETPQELFDELDREFAFAIDVCATPENHKCAVFFSLDYWSDGLDGLSQPWSKYPHPICWMNPPYSRLKEWLAKACEESKKGATVVCLIPSRTDTKAWHRYIWDKETHKPRPGVEVRFIEGRLKFGGSENSAPFPSAIIVFRPQVL